MVMNFAERSEPGGRIPAPGELRLVQQFVNTFNRENNEDALSSPTALDEWFVTHGLLDVPGRVSENDWRWAIEIRESLRGLALANNTGDLTPAIPADTAGPFDRLRFRVRLGRDGRFDLVPTGGRVGRALGEITRRVVSAQIIGSWSRVKACRMDVCRWLFYDHSKNHASEWCSPAICGNRAHVRDFRARQSRVVSESPGSPREMKRTKSRPSNSRSAE